MRWLNRLLGDDTKKLLRHLIGSFLAAILLFAMTIGLDFAKIWCEEHGVSKNICVGLGVVAFVLFVLDAVVVCGTTGIVVVRLLQRAWEHE